MRDIVLFKLKKITNPPLKTGDLRKILFGTGFALRVERKLEEPCAHFLRVVLSGRNCAIAVTGN